MAGAQGASDDTLDKLMAMQKTGAAEFTFIEQTGEYADQLRKNLEQITLPEGFEIDLYAVVPDARHMAVGTQGIAVFVGTRKTDAWAVTDRNKDRVADEVKTYAPSIAKAIPNGFCFSPDGLLYIVEQNRVLDIAGGGVLLRGHRCPARHRRAAGRADPAGGRELQPHRPRLRRRPGRQALHLARPALQRAAAGEGRPLQRMGHRRHHPHEPRRHRAARSSPAASATRSGQDFHPETGELWFTDNQVDGMGDDIPPGEINRATAPGQHFGFPWYGGGDVRTNEYKDSEPPADTVMPVVEMDAHAADLGMMFYTGDMFPGGVQERDLLRPARLVEPHRAGRRAGDGDARSPRTAPATTEPFAEGWLDENGEYLGRPVDVAQLRDGSILVSDDLAGAIYRISYQAPGG